MSEKLVLNLDKVRQGVAVGEGELLHKAQMDLLLSKIRQIMTCVSDFRQQFEDDSRQSSISHRRHHDAILLSGARGTGKTTFLLSALHKLQKEELCDDKYSFCVFEPVDPTLFGCNEHILLTLLSMIAEKVRRCRDLCDTSRYYHNSECWDLWEKQLKELAEGLRTVGEQREDIGSEPSPRKDIWDDAEYLLEQGMESARSSYELEYKLHSFINVSLKFLRKDAFVLGLDDVDTRPGIGWHVLEVLRRYLTTPQLIVIVSGNMELFQKLVERRQLKNFGLDFSSDKGVLREFSPQVTELTNQYLLKVLRTPMRIELLPFYEALEQAIFTDKMAEDSPKQIFDIDKQCEIMVYHGKKASLSSLLDTLYEALSCRDNSALKAVFRKALFNNSARTVLQIAEQLIELQNLPKIEIGMARHRQIADILRIAFHDYLVNLGISLPQAYFEDLREGVGIEEISRLLLEGKLPDDVSLRPIHGDLQVNNSLLALAGALTAAVANNASVFFIYFFKVCLALHVLRGRKDSFDTNMILQATSLDHSAFRCSSLLYGDTRRPGWRAPGIIALYSTSVEKNIPKHVKIIYGKDIVYKMQQNNEWKTLEWPDELVSFFKSICNQGEFPKEKGRPVLKGHLIATLESLQAGITSWHKDFVPHGFYDVSIPGGNYRFFSIWGLLGLMAEILACATDDDIFNTFSRNGRITTLVNAEYTNVSSDKIINSDKVNDDLDSEDDESLLGDEDATIADASADSDDITGNENKKRNYFIQWLMKWKQSYAEGISACFFPPLLCERIFTRFFNGMERLDSINSSDVFLGKYIHRALVIFFNSFLVEEYIAAHGNIETLNLTTPLSSDDIFIRNFRKVSEAENLDEPLDPTKLPGDKYPLTRLVMTCPLWIEYIKQDLDYGSVCHMLSYCWPLDDDAFDSVKYLNKKFRNLYCIFNILAIQRRLNVFFDIRTEKGKELDITPNPKKFMSKTLLDALAKSGWANTVTLGKSGITEQVAKEALETLYQPCPSLETLWEKATERSSKTAFIRGLQDLVEKAKTSGKA